MKGFLVAILLFTINFQIDLNAYSIFNLYVEPEYVLMAQKIRTDLGKKLSKRHGMRVIGTVGGMANCVNLIGLRFQLPGPQAKEKLREILVDCVEEFLQALNVDEKLRPHLKTYPFTAEGIDIAIFVVDKGERTYDPEISVVGIYEGIVTYKTTDRNNTFAYKSRVEEDYKTALQIVRGERASN